MHSYGYVPIDEIPMATQDLSCAEATGTVEETLSRLLAGAGLVKMGLRRRI